MHESPPAPTPEVSSGEDLSGSGDPRGPGPLIEISLLGIANFLLRHRLLILTLPLLVTAATSLIGAFLHTDNYTARSTFIAHAGESGDTRLAGLASQLGIRSASGSGSSPSFYSNLLRSRRVLSSVAATRFRIASPSGDSATTTLADVYEVDGATREARLRATAGLLRDKVNVDLDATTGIMSLETSAPTPEIAVQINRRLLESMNEFNRDRRQTESKTERRFVEERLNEAKQELASAEQELESFLERNRYYEGSPQLMLEASRLNRQLELRQQLYSTLAVAFEQARIEEVRYTPVITIIDDPEGSVSRVGGPSWVTLGVSSILLGLIVAIAWAALIEYLEWQRRTNPHLFAEFQHLLHQGFKRSAKH